MEKVVKKYVDECLGFVQEHREYLMYISSYEDMAELIRLGAYKKGSNRDVDEAIFYYPKIEAFLSQTKKEKITLEQGYKELADILATPFVPQA